jgi:RimJ/RimL family protein N-acetyltransferase
MVHLRNTTPDDLGFVLAAEQHPDNRPYIGQWSYEEHRNTIAQPDAGHFVLEAQPGGPAVGYAIVLGLASPHQCITLQRLVVTHKGEGHGRAALRAVKRLAFEEYGAHRLWLDVKEHNQRARALYLSEGFVEEGTLREHVRGDDGFDSMVLMGMLRHEYERLRQAQP